MKGKKTGGRLPGSQNRATKEIKGMIQQFIEGNLPDLQANYELLEPEKKLQFFKDLLQYVIPKQRDVAISEFEQYTDEQLRQIAREIMEAGHEQD